MADILKTLGGWTLVAAVGGLYWFYVQSPNRGRQAPRRGPSYQAKQEQAKVVQRQRGSSKEKKPTKNGVSEGAKGDKKSTAATDPATAAAERSLSSRPDKDDADNRAFAAQLAKTQQGTNLKAPERTSQRVRTTKQGKANKVAQELASSKEGSAKGSSTPPSTSEADADDDLSPHLSPELPATVVRTDPSGVADMIEPSAPGPASIRITPSKEPERQQRPKAAKLEPEVETKKQRQRRKKNEERKAEAAEAEAGRKKLAEEQMRRARMADGVSRTQRNEAAPTSNAWADKAGTAIEQKPNAATALLDTFEPVKEQITEAAKSVASAAEPVVEAATSAVSGGKENKKPDSVPKINGANGGSQNDLSSSELTGEWEKVPTEILDEGWQDATSKKSKKNKKKADAAAAAVESS